MESSDPRPKKAAHNSLNRATAKWFRWLHIYLSMFSLAVILFFSITGLTLNHPDWFFSESTIRHQGKVETAWLKLAAKNPENWDEVDYGHQVDKLSVAEYLRETHALSGRVTDFLCFAEECEVTFQGPGYAATARISRSDGAYEMNVTRNDLVSVLNDFHKGRHTGRVWSLVIDISAIATTLVSLSGFVLIFYLRLNRNLRLLVGLVGSIALLVLLYYLS